MGSAGDKGRSCRSAPQRATICPSIPFEEKEEAAYEQPEQRVLWHVDLWGLGFYRCDRSHCNLQRTAAGKKVGEELTALCAATDLTRGAPLTALTLPKLLLLGQEGENIDKYHTKVPRKYRARKAEDVDVVVCLNEKWINESSCTYVGGGGAIVTRQRRDIQTLIVDPERRQVIAETSFKGGTPKSCPSRIDTNDAKTIVGKRVPFTTVWRWLQNTLRL
jgi:hypothetical protein